MSLFLSDKEMVEFTGHITKVAQVTWLERNNVKFYVARSGRPVVSRATRDEVLLRSFDSSDLRPSVAEIASGKTGKFFSSREAGVYLLWDGDVVVYVGRTTHLFSRVTSHHQDKEFDRVQFVKLPAKKHDIYEMELIKTLNPKYNVMGVTRAPQSEPAVGG